MAIELNDLKDWRFEVDYERIAWATFDRENESMNTLGKRAMEELGLIVAAVEGGASRGDIRGLIIMSGKETGFIAGADIRDFQGYETAADVEKSVRQGIALFNQVEA
ncbi:MAG: 3-hydroxyacyl-CoA dehydrogenase NAD-binding domain-containing protein, partial [Methyloligellaceae bacterium]